MELPIENEKTPIIAPKKLGLKLDFGSGNTPKHGFEGVDLFATKARWQQNLFTFPWPWGDGQVKEIYCSHFIEHIPMVFWHKDGTTSVMPKEGSLDLLLKFFEESYRILEVGGRMTCIWPNNRSDRAFQDPTHRRFIPPMLMGYLNKKWRDTCGLGHYLGECNFADGNSGLAQVSPIVPNPELQLFSQEAASRRMNESWNMFADWQAVLIKE